MEREANVTAIIQARMGSSRLPGKMMLPLQRRPVINHVVSRVSSSKNVDRTVVATSHEKRDDIIEQYAARAGADVYRGSETDVLGRMMGAALKFNSDVVVRICGDCPLISPDVIDTAVAKLIQEKCDLVSNKIDRTFPRGLDVEAFTMETFRQVGEKSNEEQYREHVTPYYYENSGKFDISQVTISDVFDGKQDLSNIRLTLDEANDYELFREVFKRFGDDNVISFESIVEVIRENSLAEINSEVEQKSV